MGKKCSNFKHSPKDFVLEMVEGGTENPMRKTGTTVEDCNGTGGTLCLGQRDEALRHPPATKMCKAGAPLFREGGSRQPKLCYCTRGLKVNESTKKKRKQNRDKKIEHVRVGVVRSNPDYADGSNHVRELGTPHRKIRRRRRGRERKLYYLIPIERQLCRVDLEEGAA